MADTEMREPTFLVLTALANGRKHGYALIKEADELSGGRVSLKVGTLYAALDRLGQQGLVADAGEEVVDGRLRRYYKLTDEGADVLEREVTRLESNAGQARARLRLRPVSMHAVSMHPVSMRAAGGWA
jgi:DNA-binding PadR family transcriptional regulator